jgi:hypothetical protein
MLSIESTVTQGAFTTWRHAAGIPARVIACPGCAIGGSLAWIGDELARRDERGLRRSAACCASTAARPRRPTTITGALRRLGACLTDDAARAARPRRPTTITGALRRRARASPRCGQERGRARGLH